MKTSFPVQFSQYLLLAAFTLIPACKKADPKGLAPVGSASSSSSASSNTPPSPLVHGPPSKSIGRTTSGELAMDNLNGQISTLERLTEHLTTKSPLDLAQRRHLIELLAMRGDVAGRIADIERAAALAESLPHDAPDNPAAYLTRASMRSALHRFDDALSDLDEAEKHGAKPAQTRNTRASILAARGRLDEALTLAQESRQARPTIDSIGLVAALFGELDRQDESIAAFREAFTAYRDTSPFPVVWLFFHQGQYWERVGKPELAIAYYQATLERLPVHAHAAAHLARLKPPAEAEAILKPLFATSDDPELHFVLALKRQALDDKAGAKEHIDAAAARYDELVARHPAAYADHAAQFWLDAGGDPKKALEWAKVNLQSRKTNKAYELAVVAALANHDRKAACELGTEALTLPHLSSMLREIVKGACASR